MSTSLECTRQYFSGSAFTKVLLLSMLTAVCSSPAFAQIGGIDPDPGDRGTGGINTIQGNIFLPGGRRLGHRAQVKLRSVIGGIEQFQLSDDSGAFSFRRLNGGTYTLTIDAGKDYETSVETVDIIEAPRRRGASGMVVPVNVVLKPRAGAAPAKSGTIDASTGGVPEAARELYKRAVESAAAGDKKKAIEQLNQALKLYPGFMTALNELGVQYMAQKEWRKAADALRAALKIAPEAFHPRLNYGIVLLQMKDYKAAVVELRLAVQKDSSSAVATFNLGRALVNVGDYDAAERALRTSISLGGDESAEAHRYLGAVYIEKGDNSRAADELDTYLKLAPTATDADKIRSIVKDLRRQASATRK